MSKLKPSRKSKMPAVLFDTAHIAENTDLMKGTYIGDCPECKLTLATFDVKAVKAKCPRCNHESAPKSLIKRMRGSLSEEYVRDIVTTSV